MFGWGGVVFVCRYQKKDKHKGEGEKRERKGNSVTICTNYKLSLLGRAYRGIYTPLFYKINLVFSILFLEQSPILCSFPSFTNSIDLGQGLTVQLTVLNGLGPLDFLVLTAIIEYQLFTIYFNEKYEIIIYFNEDIIATI